MDVNPLDVNQTKGLTISEPKLMLSDRGRFPSGKLPYNCPETLETLPQTFHVQSQVIGQTGLDADPENRPLFALPSQSDRLNSKHGILPRCSVEEHVFKGKFSNPNEKNIVSGNSISQPDPESLAEALSRLDGYKWKIAMNEEFQALQQNKTWTLSDLPPGRKAIKSKWVFKTKKDVAGAIDRYKARLVIKGYSQRKGVDYDATYSPVVRHSSLRYLFALAADQSFKIEQMDAVAAFLQGDLNEEVYMEQPENFVDKEEPRKVCRLNKALYGLKQSSRVWNQVLDSKLQSFGLFRSKHNPCIYIMRNENKILIIAVYVDDLLIFSNYDPWLLDVKTYLSQTFKMKDLGPAKHCLGMRICQTSDAITLDQQTYIEEILERFEMNNCKPAATPMNVSEKLTREDQPKTDKEKDQMQGVPYQEAIGSLMYLAQCTRPDIAYAVGHLSRYSSNPGPRHWNAVKHLFRYLKETVDYKLTYSKQVPLEIGGQI